jgi:hypothetical protein
MATEYNGQLDPRYYDQNQQGGGRIANRTPSLRKFYGIEEYSTKQRWVALGVVAKAGTIMQCDSANFLVPHRGFKEKAFVTFVNALTVGKEVTIAGLTFTATVGGAGITKLAKAWSSLAASTAFTVASPQTAGTGNATFTTGSTTATFATAPALKAGTALFGTDNIFIGILASDTVTTSGTLVANPVGAGTAYTSTVAAAFSYIAGNSATTVAIGGFFTAGTLTNYLTDEIAIGDTAASAVAFVHTGADVDPTNLVVTTDNVATLTSIDIVLASENFQKLEGVLAVDVNNTAAAGYAPVFNEGTFFADDDGRSFLRWKTTTTNTIPDSEKVYNPVTNTYVTCTTYDTRCSGNSDIAKRAKERFVNGSEIGIYLFQPGANIEMEYLTNALVGSPA